MLEYIEDIDIFCIELYFSRGSISCQPHSSGSPFRSNVFGCINYINSSISTHSANFSAEILYFCKKNEFFYVNFLVKRNDSFLMLAAPITRGELIRLFDK